MPKTDGLQIGILGAGAIGQLLFHQLARGGNIPYLIGRQSEQVTLSFSDQELKQQRQARVISTQDPEQLSQLDLIIVCVKAYQVVEALKPILPLLKAESHILLLHNGLGPHLEITPYLEGRGLSLGTTSQGALREQTWQLLQTGKGLTQLGDYVNTPMPVAIKQYLLDHIPNSQWCEPILPMLWQKLAVNIAINPLTALFDCRNGELVSPQHKSLIEALLDEVFMVAEYEAIPLDKQQLTARVFDVIKLTANNYSSMHQDIANGRQTELTAITGYVIQRGKYHGIATPQNQEIYQKLQALEKAQEKISH